MSSDLELLGAAAKAAGLWTDEHMPPDNWNPLIDDGDALRLAIRLHLSPEVHFDVSQPLPWLRVVLRRKGDFDLWLEYVEPAVYAVDPAAATRRAIVRAAAATGASA
jgi:hypothetical protein